jgi:hypothetical protein
MARIRTGKPNGRPPKDTNQEVGTVDFHANLPTEIVEKIKRLRTGNETLKDVIVRLVKEYKENEL